jgi:hypothetical protein
MASANAQLYSPLSVIDDGQKVVQERRRKRYMLHMGLFVGYLVGGCILYWLLESWNPLQSLLFTLSIVTGVGFGHLAPSCQISMLITAIFIMAGLAMFATIAGQVLDYIMQAEIDAASEYVGATTEDVDYDADRNKKHHDVYQKKRLEARRQSFLTGCLNMCIIYGVALLWFIFGYGLTFCEAMYFASLSVLKLDSLCTIEGVACSPTAHDSVANETKDLILSVVWCIITYSTIGHFLVSASNYMGADPEPLMTKVNHLSKNRWHRMDKDGDGRIKRSDFLRDRLVQGKICEAADIDRILANFDEIDKNNSGVISTKDLQ